MQEQELVPGKYRKAEEDLKAERGENFNCFMTP